MDQQDNAYPGATGGNGQGRPADDGRQQKGQPAPVWEGSADGAGRGGRTREWGTQGQPAAQEPAAGDRSLWDQAPQGQTSHGWSAPAPGSAVPGWGTTAAAGQVPGPGTGWGAPQQYAPGRPARAGKRNWTAKKGALVGGIAVVVAAAAGAGAYAAANGTAAANNAQGMGAAGQFGPGSQGGMTGPNGQSGVGGSGMAGGMGMDGGPGGLGTGAAGLNAAVHSEYVVLEGSSYVTMAGQTGTVTAISGTSMTVKSEDGFSRTYAVGSDVKVAQGMRQRGSASTGSTLSFSNVATGASVRVTALKDGDTYTAETILLAASSTSTAPSSGTSSN